MVHGKAVEAARPKELLDGVVFRAVAHKADLQLEIFLRLKKFAPDMKEALHTDEDDGRARSHDIQPRARSHPDARRRPHARGGREPVDLVLAVDDDARAQKADARDDLRRHAGGVVLHDVRKPVLGDDHDERRPRAHDGVRADARLFIAQLAFIPDGKAKKDRKQDIDKIL